MKVRCASDLLKLDEGDIGTVIAIDDDEDLRGPNLEVSRKLNCNCILLWHRPFIISILPFIYIYRCTGKEKILNCGFALITLKCYQMVKLWRWIRVSQLKLEFTALDVVMEKVGLWRVAPLSNGQLQISII